MTGTPLPDGARFADFQAIDLDVGGNLLDPETRAPVDTARVPDVLARLVTVPRWATDIVVYVHGWNNTAQRATSSARRLFHGIETVHRGRPAAYPALEGFRGHYIAVRWPSMSSPLPGGYRRIRDRAHAMTTRGHAGHVLGTLLGYLNANRKWPRGRDRLQTADGQYLHCVGHSFGGRFLGEAVMEAATPRAPERLGWPWPQERFPYTVDTLLVFQMAARSDAFATDLAPLLSDAPINGPVTLTHSPADRAVGLWHRVPEGGPGIGAVGAAAPAEQIAAVRLKTVDEAYTAADVPRRILNVDAGWCYRGGRLRPEGAHSDFWYEESIHLLLSVAVLAR